MASMWRLCFLYLAIIFALFGYTACVEVNVNTTSTTTSTTPSTTTPKPDNRTVIEISLADFDNLIIPGQVFHKTAELAEKSDYIIQVSNIPVNVFFIIIQIHTQEYNVSLAYDEAAFQESSSGSLFGTNLGLEVYVNQSSSVRVFGSNNNTQSQKALVAVVAYTAKAPTPGGCNLEFEFEVSPYQKLHMTQATVTIDAQPASAPKINGLTPSCEQHPVQLDAYRMYLPERDFKLETYFDGIMKMMTVENIIKNGQKIRSAVSGSSLRRVYSAYPGTGSVYAMVATYGNYSAAYVPTVSYACSPVIEPSTCRLLNTGVSQAVCAIVLILGMIIAFVGHKCLGFEVVFLGAISGGIICYSIFAAIGYFQTSTVLGIVLGVAFLSGITWLVLSFCMGMPCVVTFLASMTLGFFVASTVYFGIADDTPLFESDVNFWLIYSGVTLLVPLVLAILPFSSNVVCCAILGSYSIILPIDYYAGSNLKYIVINTVRRATVRGFNIAVIQPPYQSTDKCLVAFLIIIALLGIYTQVGRVLSCCCCRGRNRTTVLWDDREPILSAPRNNRRVLVLGPNDRVASNSWFS